MGTPILVPIVAAIAIAASAQPCRVVGAASDSDIRLAALACEDAEARFRQLFRAGTEPLVIVLSGDAADVRCWTW